MISARCPAQAPQGLIPTPQLHQVSRWDPQGHPCEAAGPLPAGMKLMTPATWGLLCRWLPCSRMHKLVASQPQLLGKQGEVTTRAGSIP